MNIKERLESFIKNYNIQKYNTFIYSEDKADLVCYNNDDTISLVLSIIVKNNRVYENIQHFQKD